MYCKLLSDYKFLLPFLFILNLVGNGVWLFIQSTLLSVILVIVLSALFAVLEVLLFRIIPTSLLKAVYAAIMIVLHNVVGIVDYFLLYRFGAVIDLYVLNTVLLTNESEASDFISTYISPLTIVVFLVAVILVNVLVYKLSSYVSKLRYTLWTIRITAIFSIVFLAVNAALFVLFNISANAQTPMHQAFLRVGREYTRFRLGIHIDELLKACQEVKAFSTIGEPLKMIVVIGESHSVYHTSLYGYEKETYPLLKERVKKGELFVMQQAVSAHDVTSPAMWSIFSLDSMGVDTNHTPFFPAVFKAAGYRTIMYDNEFLKNDMLHVMTNSTLSDAMYDQRNTHYYKYDIDMVNDLPMIEDSLAMYILHLAGHHFEYCNRYPKEFDKYKYTDYQTTPQSQERKELIATYDNCSLYNDFVLDAIIKKFEDDNTIVVYFSDHGEELYEKGFLGHMGSRTSPDPSYQLRVPLLVWLSTSFREHHHDIVEKLKSVKDMHIKTDDISHFLIDIAGIKTDWLNKNRSFITDGEYRGWKTYQEIISASGIYTEEGTNMRQYP
jgi:heptose-I-phosphate ethanolaminephosphotransferase